MLRCNLKYSTYWQLQAVAKLASSHIKIMKEKYLFVVLMNLVFFKDFIYLFLEREEGKEKERERNINVWPHTGGLTCNPGMCPDWEVNLWPFGSQAHAQSPEPHQSGHPSSFDLMSHNVFLSHVYTSNKKISILLFAAMMKCWTFLRAANQ